MPSPAGWSVLWALVSCNRQRLSPLVSVSNFLLPSLRPLSPSFTLSLRWVHTGMAYPNYQPVSSFLQSEGCHAPLRNSSEVSVCIHLSSWRLRRRAHAHATAKRPPRALCRHSEGERAQRATCQLARLPTTGTRGTDGTSASKRGRQGEYDRDRVRPCSVCQSVIQSKPLHTGWPREAY